MSWDKLLVRLDQMQEEDLSPPRILEEVKPETNHRLVSISSNGTPFFRIFHNCLSQDRLARNNFAIGIPSYHSINKIWTMKIGDGGVPTNIAEIIVEFCPYCGGKLSSNPKSSGHTITHEA